MFRMQVGQPKVGKTEAAKLLLKNETKKVVIFDFNEDYKDVDGEVVSFEDYHPLIAALTLDEVKVLNAAYLKTSKCMLNKAEDIFRESGDMVRKGIIQESLERLQCSWEDYEVEYARELVHRIPLKPSVKQAPIKDIMSIIAANKTTVINSNSIHSDHLRAMMFLVMYYISKNEEIEVKVIADEVSTLFFKGNLKLLFEVLDLKNMDILMSCNKPSNIPQVMKEYINEWSLFKNTDKSEVKRMREMFNIGITVDIEGLELGEIITFETNSNEKGKNNGNSTEYVSGFHIAR